MKPIILHEDDHILVCVKPHGLAVQTKRIAEPDLVSILKNHLHNSRTQDREPYLALIHRLDQPVTGVLVLAKTPLAAKELNKQLTSSGFGKYYQARLTARPPKDHDTLTCYMVREPRTNLSRVCSPDTPNAKRAVLHYQVIDEQDGLTTVTINLETGRHHQIRVQMADLGCPIAGDTKYNPAPYPQGHHSPLALCACKLEFKHPKTGKPLTFSLPVEKME